VLPSPPPYVGGCDQWCGGGGGGGVDGFAGGVGEGMGDGGDCE
jgi:hypothetical protein